jgi:hypothetical protein
MNDATKRLKAAPVHVGLPETTIELFVPIQIVELNSLVEKLVEHKLVPILVNP